jgi:hypothetical protein
MRIIIRINFRKIAFLYKNEHDTSRLYLDEKKIS